jgi:hypothetical protein
LFIFVLCQIGFESFGELTPCQQDVPSAAFAFEPDIRAQAYDRPLIRSTWVLFSESEMVIKAQVG